MTFPSATRETGPGSARQARRKLKRNMGASKYARYSEAKERWIADHPNATPVEFDRAMHRIARECGI